MANAMAIVDEGLWRKDRDFQKLSRSAQCTYVQILSQKDLDTAGGLTLHLDLMAKACHELTVDQLKADIAELEALRFVFVDYETDEALVRSYVRRVSAVGDKNRAWLSVPKNARMIDSPKLRRELAKELRRLRQARADALANEIDPDPEPPSDSVATPFENEGGSNPPSTDQVPVLVSPTVVGYLGEEPSPFCQSHPDGTGGGPCFACGQAKRTHPERLSAWKERRAEIRRAAIQACELCDEYGDIDLGNSSKRCKHPNNPPHLREVS